MLVSITALSVWVVAYPKRYRRACVLLACAATVVITIPGILFKACRGTLLDPEVRGGWEVVTQHACYQHACYRTLGHLKLIIKELVDVICSQAPDLYKRSRKHMRCSSGIFGVSEQ